MNTNERSILTQPNMYARGILFGKMKYELGDHSVVRCPELGLVADIEFKTKGWVGGTYNAIGGVIRNENTGQTLYELSGLWSEEMFIKETKVRYTIPTKTPSSTTTYVLLSRLATRRCSSTHFAQNLARRKYVLSRSKMIENRRNYGKRPPKRSRSATTSLPPTKRQRSRICSAKRLLRGPLTA